MGYLLGRAQLDGAVRTEILAHLVEGLLQRYQSNDSPNKPFKFSESDKVSIECSERGLKLTSPSGTTKSKDEGFESDCESVPSIKASESYELDLSSLMDYLDISAGGVGKKFERGGIADQESSSLQTSISSTTLGRLDNSSISSSSNLLATDDSHSSSGNGSDSDEFCTQQDKSPYWELLPTATTLAHSYAIKDVVFCHCDALYPSTLVWVVRPQMSKMIGLVTAFRNRTEANELFQVYRELRTKIKSTKYGCNSSSSATDSPTQVLDSESRYLRPGAPGADLDAASFASLPCVYPTEILHESEKSPIFSCYDTKSLDYETKSCLNFSTSGASSNNYDSSCVKLNSFGVAAAASAKSFFGPESINGEGHHQMFSNGASVITFHDDDFDDEDDEEEEDEDEVHETEEDYDDEDPHHLIQLHHHRVQEVTEDNHHLLRSSVTEDDRLQESKSQPSSNASSTSGVEIKKFNTSKPIPSSKANINFGFYSCKARVKSPKSTLTSRELAAALSKDKSNSGGAVGSGVGSSNSTSSTSGSNTNSNSRKAATLSKKPILMVPLKNETLSTPRSRYPKESYLYHVMSRSSSTFAPYQRSLNFISPAAMYNGSAGGPNDQHNIHAWNNGRQILVPFSSWLELAEMPKMPHNPGGQVSPGGHSRGKLANHGGPKYRSCSKASSLVGLKTNKGTSKILLRDIPGYPYGMWANLSQRVKRNLRDNLMPKLNWMWTPPGDSRPKRKPIKEVTFNAWATVQMI